MSSVRCYDFLFLIKNFIIQLEARFLPNIEFILA